MRYNNHKLGFMMDIPVKEVSTDENRISVEFEGGSFNIWPRDRIIKCGGLGQTDIEFETCYSIYNEAGEHFGFIYTVKHETKPTFIH